MKHGVRIICLVSAWLLTGACWAQGAMNVALFSGRDAAREAFSTALSANPGITVVAEGAAANLHIALGDDAVPDACAAGVQVIVVQVGREALRWREQGCRLVAIWASPDPQVQVRLARQLLPRARRLGLLLSADSHHLLDALTAQARRDQLRLEVQLVDDAASLPVALAGLLPKVDALLAVPDPRIFNADTARLILMTSYRQGKPLIGPDDHWVRAGALASTYLASGDVLATVEQMVDAYARRGELGGDRYISPSIEINTHIARTFSLPLPDQQTLNEIKGVRP